VRIASVEAYERTIVESKHTDKQTARSARTSQYARHDQRLRVQGRRTMSTAIESQPTLRRAQANPKQNLSWSNLKKRLNRSKRSSVLIIGGIVLIGAVAAGILIQQTAMTKEEAETSQSSELIENLEYQTVIPEGNTISDLGGWRRVSPPGEAPVYAYSDKIGGVAINVSQQPLPASFVGKVDREIAELAKAYSATTEITAGETKAYLGTSAKGPQSVIFTKNNLLIMIKSQQQITNDAWSDYIKALD